jgi:hypothetical protein
MRSRGAGDARDPAVADAITEHGSAQEECDRAERVGRVSAVGQRQLAIGSRKFTVYHEGDPVGPAILIHHGTPGAGPPYSPRSPPGTPSTQKKDRSGIFSYYNKEVEIHDSARKHGVADQNIVHAIDYALVIEDAGEDPDRWLLIGPDTAGNLLEVVVLLTAEGTQIVIHAMPMRDKYARLLEP